MGCCETKLQNISPADMSIEQPDTVNGYSVSPDKKWMAIGSGSNKVRLYDMSNQKVVKDFEGCTWSKLDDNKINIAWCPSSSKFAFRWEKSIQIYNVNSLEKEQELKTESSFVWIQFSPDGGKILAGCTSDYLSVYDLSKDSSTALIKSVEARVQQHVQINENAFYKQTIGPQWSNDSQYIVSRWNNIARVWKVESDDVVIHKELTHESPTKQMIKQNDVWTINFSPDGAYLAIGFGRYEVALYDAANFTQLHMLKGCAYSQASLACIMPAFSPDSKLLALRQEKKVLIYDISSGQVLQEICLVNPPYTLAFSPDQQYLLVGTTKVGAQIFKVFATPGSATQGGGPVSPSLMNLEVCIVDQYAIQVHQPVWVDNQMVLGRWEKTVRIWKTGNLEIK